MSQASNGSKVKVHYTGTFDDGTVFDSSRRREPLEFVLGERSVIPGFESGVLGMAVGDTRTVTIPSKEAYGEYNAEYVMNVERDQFPGHIDPQLGMTLQVQSEGGQGALVTITALDEASITLDGNHPLAGKDLTFEIELVEIG